MRAESKAITRTVIIIYGQICLGVFKDGWSETNTPPCHAMHMIMFLEISRISARTRALGAYLHSKCNLSRIDEDFSFHFVRWTSGYSVREQGQGRCLRVGAREALLSLAGNHEREANWARARRTNRKPRDFNSQSGDFEFGLHTPMHCPCVRVCVSVRATVHACACVCVWMCLYLFNVVVLVLALGVFYGAPPEYLPLYNGVLVPTSRHCRRHHRRIKSKLKPRSVSHKPVESTQS